MSSANKSNKKPAKWSLTMSLPQPDGNALEAQYVWREEFSQDGKSSIGHWGYLVDPSTGEDLRLDETVEKPFKAAASAFRVSQLRLELKVREISNLFESRDKAFAEKILELFERNQSGDYLGQSSNNDLFYVQDAAKILDLSMKQVLSIVDQLVNDGKLGLNGMILVPHEDYTAAFTYWEEATGHKRLSVGDFGNWFCAHCNRHGDEYENPVDFPCESPLN